MSDREHVGSVVYAEVDEAYFKKRELRRYARALHLWGLGVGAVISGDFFGWSFGLISGGFGGLLIATLVISAVYLALSFSIAEMSAALPHTGGAYSFARSSMGPWGGYVTGLAENMEYVLTPATIVVGIGGYLGAIVGTSPGFAPVWWLAIYAIFIGVNIRGVEASFRFSVFVALLALAVLAVFVVGAIPHLDIQRWAMNIPPAPGGSRWLPFGIPGIFAALPFAIWFYLGIEELPLAAEESHDPKRDIPRGMILGILTLIVSSLLVLVLNSGIAPGALAIGHSTEPLFEGFKTVFGNGLAARIFSLLAVAGLVASFHTIIFAYGRQIYSLSRAGYFPRFLSVTHGTRQTPHVALIAGGVIGFVAALAGQILGDPVRIGAMLLSMAVFGAVISYILQMASFILLRIRLPHIERPYRSPLGIPGALFVLVVSAITLETLFVSDQSYRTAVIGATIWYALGLLWFAVIGRKRLVRSPEEEFAMRELARGAELRAAKQ